MLSEARRIMSSGKVTWGCEANAMIRTGLDFWRRVHTEPTGCIFWAEFGATRSGRPLSFRFPDFPDSRAPADHDDDSHRSVIFSPSEALARTAAAGLAGLAGLAVF